MSDPAPPPQPTGLILAMAREFACFAGELEPRPMLTVAGLGFHAGRIDGRPVVAVMSGIGKVNAAIATTLLIEELGCRAVICSGVAGAMVPRLGIGDAVVATRAIQHDYGALVGERLVRYQPGVPPLPGLPTQHGYDLAPDLLTRVREAVDDWLPPPFAVGGRDYTPALHYGPVLSGDQFMNCAVSRDRLAGETAGLAVEMEGAAIAQTATALGVPWLVLRTVSDLAGADSHLDFLAFVDAVADGAAALVRRVLPVV